MYQRCPVLLQLIFGGPVNTSWPAAPMVRHLIRPPPATDSSPLAEESFSHCTVHSLTHPGISASRQLLSSRFMWKGMAADVGRWCRECTACEKAKVMTRPTAPIQPIPIPDRCFTHLHLDLVGPLTASSNGHTHIITMIDTSTRWVEVVPLTSATATAGANALVSGWISIGLWCQLP